MRAAFAGAALALVLAASGCVLPAGGGSIDLPSAPWFVAATYAVEANGQDLGALRVEGFVTERATLPDGSTGDYPALRATFLGAGEPAACLRTYTLPHASGGTLASASLDAEGVCPQGADDRVVEMPDLWASPGFLGAGPFLGTTLVVPSTRVVALPDPAGDAASVWTATRSEAWRGRSCVELVAERPSSAKLALPLAPTWGRIVLCEGLALPVAIEQGPVRLSLGEASTGGALVAPPAAPTFPATRGDPCRIRVPPHDETTLPSATYAAWARREDAAVAGWLDDHPASTIAPGYGRARIEEASALLPVELRPRSYPVQAMLLLVDPASGDAEAWLAGERWERGLLGTRSTMESSEPTGATPVVRVPPRPPVACGGSEVDLEALVERALQSTGFGARMHYAFVGPHLATPWEGSLVPYGPFLGDSRAAIARDLAPAVWPERVYVRFVPDAAVGPLAGAVVDPASGALRWFEAER